MNTKTCPKCGWEYPNIEANYTCRFCHTKLTSGICRRCGEPSERIYRGLCTNCETLRHTTWMKERRKARSDEMSEWLDKIKEIPKPYKTLTEEQWLEACKHFNGCALCGSDDVSTRLMFIEYKDGGRYCAWNIIPACEKCTTLRKSYTSPFSRMDFTLSRNKFNPAKVMGFTLERLRVITDYLERKMHDESQ